MIDMLERAWNRCYRRHPGRIYRVPLYRRWRDSWNGVRCQCWQGDGSARDRTAVEGLWNDVEQVVIIVHGTWARHARWARSGPLHAALAESAHVLRFCWSGRNRHRDRLEAAGSLRRLIGELRQSRPELYVDVVAHSHGGNVALHAINADHQPASVRVALAEVRLVTLATPYLSMTPRPLSNVGKSLCWLILLMASMGAAFTTLVVAAAIDVPFRSTGSHSASRSSLKTVCHFGCQACLMLLDSASLRLHGPRRPAHR